MSKVTYSKPYIQTSTKGVVYEATVVRRDGEDHMLIAHPLGEDAYTYQPIGGRWMTKVGGGLYTRAEMLRIVAKRVGYGADPVKTEVAIAGAATAPAVAKDRPVRKGKVSVQMLVGPKSAGPKPTKRSLRLTKAQQASVA